MADVTTSLDAATQQVMALLAQLKTGNARFVTAVDTGAADHCAVSPIGVGGAAAPAVSGYGPDLVLIVDVATPNLTNTPRLSIVGLPEVPILAADGSAPAIGTVAGKRLIGFSTAPGGGYAARLIGLAPADVLPLLLPAIAANTPGRLLSVQVFPASGLYAPNALATVVEAEGVGGGGAGAGCGPGTAGYQAAGGGGGGGLQGAGRFGAAQVAGALVAGKLPITVGAGGASTNGTGNNGTASSFGGLMTLGGGGGAYVAIGSNTGGAVNPQGQGSFVQAGCGLWSVRGADGGLGIYASNGGALYSGFGGSGFRGGGGGVAVGASTTGTGASPGYGGLAPGSGGSGAAQNGSQNTSPVSGGAGAPGLIIVREFA